MNIRNVYFVGAILGLCGALPALIYTLYTEQACMKYHSTSDITGCWVFTSLFIACVVFGLFCLAGFWWETRRMRAIENYDQDLEL